MRAKRALETSTLSKLLCELLKRGFYRGLLGGGIIYRDY